MYKHVRVTVASPHENAIKVVCEITLDSIRGGERGHEEREKERGVEREREKRRGE